MTVDARLMTADELLRLPDDGYRYELVRGELKRMSPGGAKHGKIGMRIGAPLGTYVVGRRLGEVFTSETSFLLSRNPDTVRCPDVAFVRTERLVDTDAAYPGAPDLVVEVISPGDTHAEVLRKTAEYLNAGVQAVILVDPRRKSVIVHRPSGATPLDEVLAVEDVVPGWQIPLSAIFE
ncbi:MAG TPA: Uma2 family endonuclease [Thermoanaerobaculia bacterium]|nr:Uma2 family endonuclease [Thermoanaerobaculia bacterium]